MLTEDEAQAVVGTSTAKYNCSVPLIATVVVCTGSAIQTDASSPNGDTSSDGWSVSTSGAFPRLVRLKPKTSSWPGVPVAAVPFSGTTDHS